MTINDATDLIKACTISHESAQHWADLGCGNGVFSYALASLMPPASNIVCVDKSPQDIKPQFRNVSLRFEQADLQMVSFAPASLSGLLMANALHYIKNQPAFIERAGSFLSVGASWLIVEYDTDKANPWVPYPVSVNSLKNLFATAGYGIFRKLGERASVYRRANLYACEIKKDI